MSADRYDPDKLEYDKQLITEYYNNNGYPDFNFVTAIAQLSLNSNDFEIILTVNEGEKFGFGEISVSSELKKLNTDVLENALSFISGDIYDASKIKDSVQDIKSLAEIKGYCL